MYLPFIVLADQNAFARQARQINVVFDDHDVPCVIIRVYTSRSVRYDQGSNPHRVHHSYWHSDLKTIKKKEKSSWYNLYSNTDPLAWNTWCRGLDADAKQISKTWQADTCNIKQNCLMIYYGDCPIQDLNQQPCSYKHGALTNWATLPRRSLKL